MTTLDGRIWRASSWTGVSIEIQDARTSLAALVLSPMWRQFDKGQRRAVGQLLRDLRLLAAAVGDA